MARSYRNTFDRAVLQVADSTSARSFDAGQPLNAGALERTMFTPGPEWPWTVVAEIDPPAALGPGTRPSCR